MMKKLSLSYILIFSFLHPIFSQTVLKDVNEAIELVRKNNPDLQLSRQNAEVQQWNVTAAKGTLLPQLKFTTAFDYNFVLPTQLIPAQFFGGKEGEFRSIQFGVPFNLTAGLEGNVPLWNAGLKQEVELSKANQKIGLLQTLVLQDDLSTQMARLYFATVFTKQYIDITQQNLANTDSIARIAAERKEKGLIDQLEYNRVRAARLAIEDVLHQNEMAYQKNLNQLRLVAGDSSVIIASPGPLSLQEKEHILSSRYLKKEGGGEVPRLQLRAAQFSLAKEQLKKEQKLRLPTLSAYARYSEQAQRNQLNFLNFNEKWFGIGVAGLRFEAPLYSGRIRESGIARARINADIARRQLDNEKRKYDSETQDLLIAYHQSLNSLQINREAYQLNEENMKLVLIKYKGGILSYDQYLNVFNEVLNAQNKYLRTLADVMINGKLLEIRNSY
ncbi:TolC family protein [Runella slithyformis]|uniref:Outer membrane efflux protein n=1 Tax=Runella slithyformis (strain ATCC 29530 / DSM 19594 / LMG 11500 / NCIMB 11436 / LSU 4) TaxID=761193 RepID=A0A7U4E5C9_RUNSL|nr:TolC family protein [Runella slithyformis]AEI48058.1 outer membrane efflux protein [Runella slithyformis DSM 19594]